MGGSGGFRGSCRVGAVLLFSAWVALAALSRLLRPVPNGCVMTYMYPTYIPIAATPRNISSDRYGLFLYHEGWKQIDFAKHIRGLRGVPVLFIPGNGGSYKQVQVSLVLLLFVVLGLELCSGIKRVPFSDNKIALAVKSIFEHDISCLVYLYYYAHCAIVGGYAN